MKIPKRYGFFNLAEILRTASKKVFRLKTISPSIQIGLITPTIKSRYPIGLYHKAPPKSPFNILINDLVLPQLGQGIPVTFLKIHTVYPV